MLKKDTRNGLSRWPWRDCAQITRIFLVVLGIIIIFFGHALAVSKDYDLTIAWQQMNFTGKAVPAMTINGSIPGPTLRFTEGDYARIRVHNRMDVETSIHWHGLLVPPNMDGVPFISFPPIAPGSTFTYEFPIRQSGTYWYHSHTNLQEQRGVYGSIVISPLHGDTVKPDRDYVVLLSDWTDEDPPGVNLTLKRGTEWYAIAKGSGQSIFGAARLGMLNDYFKRELMRMPAMDIADVAYDRFLVNGKPESHLPAQAHESVRLRIINGSATTYFYLEFAGGPLSIISADGLAVETVEETRLLISVAETYDVLVRIPEGGAYELRATAHDGSGYASVWLGGGRKYPAATVPLPNLYHSMEDLSLRRIFALTPAGVMGMNDSKVEAGLFDQPGSMMHGANTGNMVEKKAGHGQHQHDSNMQNPMHAKTGHFQHKPPRIKNEWYSVNKRDNRARFGKKYSRDFGWLAADIAGKKDLAADGMDPRRPWPPYEKLRAPETTSFSANKPIREIRLTLDGDMERYVWFLNNKALSESDSILVREGEITRFILINRTMMHHPMHLHGHFFRVLNGQGDYSPLKHTVNVAPMSTTVIEFEANEVGDWFFHCHLLYHMKAGMARIVHYENFPLPNELVGQRPQLQRDPGYIYGEVMALSNMTDGYLSLANTRNILKAGWEIGWEHVDDTEWESVITWDRYINRFLSLLIGADMTGVGGAQEKTRGILGLRYLLPLNIESTVWADTDSGGRGMLEKDFALTPRLLLFGEAEYDTHEKWEGKAGISYTMNRTISLVGGWHSEYHWGAGLQFTF